MKNNVHRILLRNTVHYQTKEYCAEAQPQEVCMPIQAGHCSHASLGQSLCSDFQTGRVPTPFMELLMSPSEIQM